MAMSTTVGGVITASITCTTPFEAMMSSTITCASLMNTFPSPSMVTLMSGPSAVAKVSPSDNEPASASAPTTWYKRMSASAPSGSAKSASTTS